MAKDFLLEIGLEEVPARFIRDAAEQLANKIERWLSDSRLHHQGVESFATPRRLAVMVRSLAEKQEDTEEETKGPAKKIAIDEEGNWTKAALGFARSQNVEPESLFFKELNGVEYVYAVKSSVGMPTEEILPEQLKEIISSLHFPKNMRWGSHDFRFVRPIRWLTVLYGDQIVPLEITGVNSGNVSKGHRFLGNDVVISSAGNYELSLEKEKVIVNIEKRKQEIVTQIGQLAQKMNWEIEMKEDLLEEVLFLVEFPTVLYGSFEQEFLQIPQDVLITSMREHQRYFPVKDKEGNLLPYFVTVRNGDNRQIDQVAKGNEKVLRARLADARFFYEEDQKLPIDSALQKLEKVVFHEELGTIGDKVRRIRSIAEKIANALALTQAEIDQVKRTATICKFDLVTQMVYEFPELQGVMGADYAEKAGEDPHIARAIFEHYQPRFSGDQSPVSILGAIVSIADKLDTLIGCFGIGIIPTGSQDPYGLRRQAAGIVQILQDHDMLLKLTDLIDIGYEVYQQSGLTLKDKSYLAKDLMDFFALRVKNTLSELARYDIVDAIMEAGFDHLSSTVGRTKALANAVSTSAMKEVVEAFNRVQNLAAKAEDDQLSESLFENDQEKQLFQSFCSAQTQFETKMGEENYVEALRTLADLKEPIHSFFDHVMVMAEDEAVRANRLALLKKLSELFHQFADFKKLVWS